MGQPAGTLSTLDVSNTHCLRCGTPCRLAAPKAGAKIIQFATKAGLCANCMVTRFLLAVEPIAETINGTPARGDIVPARAGKGPEILLGGSAARKSDAFHQAIRAITARILHETAMCEDQIDWLEVVSNWHTPFPKGHEPKPWF